MKILITGASGFIGCSLARHLALDNKNEIVAAVRHHTADLEKFTTAQHICELSETTDWSQALAGVDVVVHAAARVHIMREDENELPEFRRVNVLATSALARQAAKADVKRFVFISSIAVNGEATNGNEKFTAESTPSPTTAYGISKYEAEETLKEISQETEMELVIIRPPLVYGEDARGNYATIVKLINSGLPLPLGGLKALRSLVSVENLVEFIELCSHHPTAVNQTFLVSDGEDISTTKFIKNTATTLGKKAVLLAVPSCLLKFMLGIIGKGKLAQRICAELRIDISKNQELLGWKPK